ncbi:MAG: hypothetical protein ACXW3S_08485, partial [Rhodoplanes sp.]
GVRNRAAPGRSATWTEGEVARLYKRAWRDGYQDKRAWRDGYQGLAGDRGRLVDADVAGGCARPEDLSARPRGRWRDFLHRPRKGRGSRSAALSATARWRR